jgi:hypothetical protein
MLDLIGSLAASSLQPRSYSKYIPITVISVLPLNYGVIENPPDNSVCPTSYVSVPPLARPFHHHRLAVCAVTMLDSIAVYRPTG